MLLTKIIQILHLQDNVTKKSPQKNLNEIYFFGACGVHSTDLITRNTHN